MYRYIKCSKSDLAVPRNILVTRYASGKIVNQEEIISRFEENGQEWIRVRGSKDQVIKIPIADIDSLPCYSIIEVNDDKTL